MGETSERCTKTLTIQTIPSTGKATLLMPNKRQPRAQHKHRSGSRASRASSASSAGAVVKEVRRALSKDKGRQKKVSYGFKLPAEAKAAFALVRGGSQAALARTGPGRESMHTLREVFHASLLSHLLDRSTFYPLPGVSTPGFAGSIMSQTSKIGDYGGDGVTDSHLWDPNTIESSMLANDSDPVQMARYGIQRGQFIHTFSTVVNATPALNTYWVLMDPLSYNYPLYVWNPTTGGTGTGSIDQGYNWTENPFLYEKTWSSVILADQEDNMSVRSIASSRTANTGKGQKQPPSRVGAMADTMSVDEANLYYVGNSTLTVINATANLTESAVTMNARGYDNVARTFVERPWDTYFAGDHGFDTAEFLNADVPANSALSTHSGSKWNTLSQVDDTTIISDAVATDQVAKRFVRG